MDLKPPIHYQLIETEDGSMTFFSEVFQEACHSTSGAKSETITHYIKGCKILEKAQTLDSQIILEVGFGLGVGFMTTLELYPNNKNLHFISLELDKNLLDWFVNTHPNFHFSWHENILSGKIGQTEITIICGDARIELPLFLEKNKIKWHSIYQDAFSPKKSPTLWTKEWFTLLKNHSHEEAILSTYSASSSIRKSLVEAGWGVFNGEKFGPKRSSTRAYLNQVSDEEVLKQLSRSPVSPLTDLNIKENV